MIKYNTDNEKPEGGYLKDIIDLDNAVEGGSWSVSGDQLTINTPDTTLLLVIESVDRDNAVLSLDIVENTNDNGVTIDVDITQTINSTREW